MVLSQTLHNVTNVTETFPQHRRAVPGLQQKQLYMKWTDLAWFIYDPNSKGSGMPQAQRWQDT